MSAPPESARPIPPAIAALPRFGLFEPPSPLQPLPRFSAALGGAAEIWIKREDLLPLAFGGNKLRNLEFLVGAALAAGADTLVTAGRRWSNHCRLTAAAGAVAGLEVHLVLGGPWLAEPGPNERLDVLLGATLHRTSGEDRAEREALVDRTMTELRAAGRRPFAIGVGGGGPIGAAGQVLAGLEVATQAAEGGSGIDAIVLPSATGGTQAGLLTGLALAGSAARVAGIAVAHPSQTLRPIVAGLLDELVPLTGQPAPTADRIELDDAQLGPGYGRPTAEAAAATELLARTEGILVDPIYTAKALAGLVAAVRDGRLGGRVVFWHAGGLPGAFEVGPG